MSKKKKKFIREDMIRLGYIKTQSTEITRVSNPEKIAELIMCVLNAHSSCQIVNGELPNRKTDHSLDFIDMVNNRSLHARLRAQTRYSPFMKQYFWLPFRYSLGQRRWRGHVQGSFQFSCHRFVWLQRNQIWTNYTGVSEMATMSDLCKYNESSFVQKSKTCQKLLDP